MPYERLLSNIADLRPRSYLVVSSPPRSYLAVPSPFHSYLAAPSPPVCYGLLGGKRHPRQKSALDVPILRLSRGP